MKFTGELHNVKLINFSVDLQEVLPMVPQSLKVFQENGKAIISMVDVQLKNMRPTWLPFFKFGYRHVAFRLLLDDSKFNKIEPKGIYFLKSFSNRPLMNWVGNLISNYKLTNGKIKEIYDAFSLKQMGKYVDYALDPFSEVNEDNALYQKIHRIDRAYATEDNGIFVTKIARKHWPIEQVKCYHFATNFFKSAKLLGAFKVKDVIHYTWNEPKKVISF